MQEVLQMRKRRMRSKMPLRFSRVSKAQIEKMRRHHLIGRIMKRKKEEELPRWCMGRTKVTKIIQLKTSKNQFHKLDHGQQEQTQRLTLKLEIREKIRVPMNRGYIH